MQKTISIVSPCFNEEENVQEIYRQVRDVFDSKLPNYNLEFIFIDNDSQDRTRTIIRQLAAQHKEVKAIFNSRNFGHIRSPMHGILQATGDAVVLIASDLQDPPELIVDFVRKWEEGNEVVIGVKSKSRESALMYAIRGAYYNTIGKLSDIKLQKNYTGFGLYDRKIVEIVKQTEDPYPYFRGMIFEIGYNIAKVEFCQPTRKRGITKNNFFSLYDMAMLGITSHSKIPLRLATISGFLLSLLSLLVAFCYFLYKIFFWDRLTVGVAPLIDTAFLYRSAWRIYRFYLYQTP